MEETGFSQRLLMGPHRFDSNLNLDFSISSEDDPKRAPNNDSCTIGRFRSRAQMIVHFLMELHMLRRDVKVLVFGLSWQWIHSVFTNLAYYYQAKLSAIQRQPLQDVAFDLLPTLNGKLWMASEYLVYSMVLVVVVSVFLILFVQFRAPHGRPLYCIPILRRMLLTLVVCQSLRIVSFMCTTLPGASRQCLYKIQHNITLADLMSGPAPPQGNPDRWKPPDTVWDILFRMDPTNGCGDLMFSSHTIFTMLFVCVIWRYFSWKPLKTVMLLCQVRWWMSTCYLPLPLEVNVCLTCDCIFRSHPDTHYSTDLGSTQTLQCRHFYSFICDSIGIWIFISSTTRFGLDNWINGQALWTRYSSDGQGSLSCFYVAKRLCNWRLGCAIRSKGANPSRFIFKSRCWIMMTTMTTPGGMGVMKVWLYHFVFLPVFNESVSCSARLLSVVCWQVWNYHHSTTRSGTTLLDRFWLP